jgi:chemotaxis protein CheD
MQKADTSLLKYKNDSDEISIQGKASSDTMTIKKYDPAHSRDELCFSYNRRFNKKSINIIAGDCFVSDEDIIMTTVLGSCISVCLYSDYSEYCGMNHFMLPRKHTQYGKEKDIMHSDAAFYGINAMEMLINTFFKIGIKKSLLKSKVFGGGNVFQVRSGESSVGEQNVDFVMKFLKIENIPVTSCSIGGDYARKILFFTRTHEVYQFRLKKTIEERIAIEERRLHYETTPNTGISFF